MTRTVIKHVVVLAFAALLFACSKSAAPSCEDVGEAAVSRTLRAAERKAMPEKVRDDLYANRAKLAARAEQMCEQRGWSAKVRRCKAEAKTDLAAAACEANSR